MNFLGKPDKNLTNLSDEQLLGKYRDSLNTDCISELFCRYTTLVYGVCKKYLEDPDDAKDAVLHIFEKLISALKTEKPESFRPWLYTVSKNHCLMQLRKPHQVSFESEKHESIMESDSLMHPEEEEQKMQKLEAARNSLPEGQQVCIQLFFIEEKSYKEIVDLTGFSLNEVKSHIQNGKRNLKITLEKGGFP
jgi:RNA polymerase sigma-70 factor (ECF subfamily)